MKKNSTIGLKTMKPDLPLQFEFFPSKNDADRNNGWGSGTLHVLGTPYWYADSNTEPTQPAPIEWTWVDLLEHLASNWASLTIEQPYPYPWLSDAAHPGEIWHIAEKRWARLGEETAEKEENSLLSFERRHNLAYAWKGLSLPSLTFMRIGNSCWICREGQPPIRAGFEDCQAALLSICDTLAKSFEGSDNPRVTKAISQWRDRGTRSRKAFLELATGMSQQTLTAIQGTTDPFEFWGVAANDSWANGFIEEGPLLAAARMTAGIFDTETVQKVILAIRQTPPGDLEALNEVSIKVCRRLQNSPAQFAFSSGYAAAELLRETLDRDGEGKFDIKAVMQKLNINMRSFSLGVTTIDAIAVWGSRGPCVILNEDRQHINSTERTRMTLAHELGHLILDRDGGLPFCDVMGGAVDNFMEQRAYAFAADLLLPRRIVEKIHTLWKESLGEFVKKLSRDFAVSKSVVYAQIRNSHVFDRLRNQDQVYVDEQLQGPYRMNSKYTKVQPTGKII